MSCSLNRLCPVCAYRFEPNTVPTLEPTRGLLNSTRTISNQVSHEENHAQPDPGDFQKIEIGDATETKTSELAEIETRTCSICLGILTMPFLGQVASEICSILDAKSYDCEDYSLAIGLPISVQLRNAAAIKVNEKSTQLELKLTLKHLVSVLVCEKSPDRKYSARSDVQLTIAAENHTEKSDIMLLENLFPGPPRSKKAKLTKKADLTPYLTKIGTVTSFPEFLTPDGPPNFAVTCTRTPLYIGGRYNKFSRFLNQTPWFLDGKRMSANSVEEIICLPLNHVIGGTNHAMTSSGREDIDVRMLGRGRPFMLTFDDPKRKSFSDQDLQELETKINLSTADVKVSRLKLLTNASLTQVLRVAEETKRKHYTAICYCPTVISSDQLSKLDVYQSEELKIRQKTPLRVMHRRSVAERERVIHKMTYVRMNDNYFQLSLVTQAGTYIKEFVHSDLGRTEPSLGDLLGVKGQQLDILELDVQDVEMEWP